MKCRKGERIIDVSPKAFRIIYAPQGYIPVTEKLDVDGINNEKNEGSAPEAYRSEEALENMSAEELKAMAGEKGLKGYSSLNKSELIQLLKGVI